MLNPRLAVAVFFLSVATAGAQTVPEIQPPSEPGQQQQSMLPPAASDDASCVCTMEYHPMCGQLGDGTRKTFANECQAMCESAEIVAIGSC